MLSAAVPLHMGLNNGAEMWGSYGWWGSMTYYPGLLV